MPPSTSGLLKSASDWTITIRNAFASAGFSSGTKTPLKVCQRLARRVYDASSSEG
ncbi:hypothetical protein D3C85_1081490 [compost metagenome]